MENVEAPDYVGKIIGVREWYIVRRSWFEKLVRRSWFEKPQLRSTGRSYVWTSKEQEAACTDFGRKAPEQGCGCGLYAFYNYNLYRAKGDNLFWQGMGVTGIVSAWGDIELHEVGFKAEYMRIEALVRPPLGEQNGRTLKKLAKAYDVPLISYKEVEGFIESLEGGIVLDRQRPTEEVAVVRNPYNTPIKHYQLIVPPNVQAAIASTKMALNALPGGGSLYPSRTLAAQFSYKPMTLHMWIANFISLVANILMIMVDAVMNPWWVILVNLFVAGSILTTLIIDQKKARENG